MFIPIAHIFLFPAEAAVFKKSFLLSGFLYVLWIPRVQMLAGWRGPSLTFIAVSGNLLPVENRFLAGGFHSPAATLATQPQPRRIKFELVNLRFSSPSVSWTADFVNFVPSCDPFYFVFMRRFYDLRFKFYSVLLH